MAAAQAPQGRRSPAVTLPPVREESAVTALHDLRAHCPTCAVRSLCLPLNLDEHSIGAVIMGDSSVIEEGREVKPTGEVLSIPVGDEGQLTPVPGVGLDQIVVVFDRITDGLLGLVREGDGVAARVLGNMGV